MSLRLLLADESPSIKRAFEIALKDFGVQVQQVFEGDNVKNVYDSFNPDVCFLDVLLPKLNGYDACAQLKSDPGSSNVPCVLMWSSFMELDQDKYVACSADHNIEKPFETQTLRALIQQVVPRLQGNEFAQHVSPEEVQPMSEPGSPPPLPLQPEGAGGTSENNSLEPSEDALFSLDLNQPNESSAPSDIDSFSFESLASELSDGTEGNSGFEDIEEFKLESLNPEETEESSAQDSPPPPPEGFENLFSENNEDPEQQTNFHQVQDEEIETFELPPLQEEGISLAEAGIPVEEPHELPEIPPHPSPEQRNEAAEAPGTTLAPSLSKEELKRLIMAQSKDVIESVVWEVVPELARELIQKEINRLMGDAEKADGEIR